MSEGLSRREFLKRSGKAGTLAGLSLLLGKVKAELGEPLAEEDRVVNEAVSQWGYSDTACMSSSPLPPPGYQANLEAYALYDQVLSDDQIAAVAEAMANCVGGVPWQ